MIILLSALLIFVSICLVVSIFYCYRFAIKLLNIASALELTLDVLDSSYADIHSVLSIPLFTDNDEVKKVILNVQRCRDSILETAKVLTTIDESTDDVNSEEEA